MRILFLFNHDAIHQIAHSLPAAIEIDRMRPGTVTLAVGNATIRAEVERLLTSAGSPLTVRTLTLNSRGARLLDSMAGQIVPAAKLLLYRENLDFFRRFDILVVPEKTSLLLKTRHRLPLRIVHTRHGAGDRAIGFDPASALFDHVLVAGPLIRQRLMEQAHVPPERISVVGYQKFDVASGAQAPLFANDRPTVLYNPHVSPHLSSWYDMGPQVLDHFLASDRYNLIFAPHVMLFRRRWAISIDRFRLARPGRIEQRWRDAPNIHIDTGSAALTDMTYTRAADIYLGDVSSQVYEFLLRPRPCVFLDPTGAGNASNPDYAYFAAGPVVHDIADLERALDLATRDHPGRYRAVQERLFAERFDLTETPSARRAAEAVLAFAAREGLH